MSTEKEYTVVATGLKAPSSNWSDIRCGHCGTVSRAFWWSLAGSGKRCVNKECRALHNSYGTSVLPKRKTK